MFFGNRSGVQGSEVQGSGLVKVNKKKQPRPPRLSPAERDDGGQAWTSELWTCERLCFLKARNPIVFDKRILGYNQGLESQDNGLWVVG